MQIKIDNYEINLVEQPNITNRRDLIELYWNYHSRFRFFKTSPSQSKILDVGAGVGGLYYWLDYLTPSRTDIQLYGIDLSKGKLFDRYTDYQVGNLNSDKLKWPDKYFNSIIVSHVIEHIENIEVFLSELKRVLKSNGRIYFEFPSISTYNLPTRQKFLDQNISISTFNFYDDPTHIKSYTISELSKLLESKQFHIINTGVVKNHYLEDDLIHFGYHKKDEECLTYGLWSKTNWAEYIEVTINENTNN